MNKVILIGRLTKSPELKYAAGSERAVTRFSVAVNRPMKKDEADFINCVAFGKTAETIGQYLEKGSPIALEGRIQTGSYEKGEQTVYTTDVIVDRFEFVAGGEKREQSPKDLDKHLKDVIGDDLEIDNGDIPF